MKNSKLAKILIIAFSLAVLVGTVIGIQALASTSEEKSLKIASNNISSNADISIMYAVEAKGFDANEEIQFSVWDSDPSVADGQGNYPEAFVSKKLAGDTTKITIDGVSYDFLVFGTPGIPSKNLCDSYYVQVNSGDVKSEIYRYSILEYLFERMYTCANTEEQLDYYEHLIGYGEYSQKLFGYNTDALPSDYRYVAIVDGTVNGDRGAGIYKLGDTVTLKYNGTAPNGSSFRWDIFDEACNVKSVKDGATVTVESTMICKPSVAEYETVDFNEQGESGSFSLPTGFSGGTSNLSYVNFGTDDAPDYALAMAEPTANVEMTIASDKLNGYDPAPFGRYTYSVKMKYDFEPNGVTGDTLVGAIVLNGGNGYAGLIYVYARYDGTDYSLYLSSTTGNVAVGGITYTAGKHGISLVAPVEDNEWFNFSIVIDRRETVATSATNNIADGTNDTMVSVYVNDLEGNSIAKLENVNYYYNQYWMGMSSEPMKLVWRSVHGASAFTYTMYMDDVEFYGERPTYELIDFNSADPNADFAFTNENAFGATSQTGNLTYINVGTESEPDYALRLSKPADSNKEFYIIPDNLNGYETDDFGRYIFNFDMKLDYKPADVNTNETQYIGAFIFSVGGTAQYAFQLNLVMNYTAPSTSGGEGTYKLWFDTYNGTATVDGITYPAGSKHGYWNLCTYENNSWVNIKLVFHREETLITGQTDTAVTGVQPSYYSIYASDENGKLLSSYEYKYYSHNLYRTGILEGDLWLGFRTWKHGNGDFSWDVDNIVYYGENASGIYKQEKHGNIVEAYDYNATATEDGTYSELCTLCDTYTNRYTSVAVGTSEKIADAFSGLNISILGDSISSFAGVSDGAAAETSNSTIANNGSYYYGVHNTALGITQADTWWQQTVDSLGANLLVNNSYAGSYIRRTNGNAVGAYAQRCVNLHDDTGDNAGTEPDIILIYLGTNDICADYASFGDPNAIDYDNLSDIADAAYGDITTAEAYAVMLYKIITTYENAEIYCLNVLESSYHTSDMKNALPFFNAMIETVCARMGVNYVDICEKTGIRRDDSSYDTYIPSYDGDDTVNYFHPGNAGMDLITECVLEAIVKNSKYAGN